MTGPEKKGATALLPAPVAGEGVPKMRVRLPYKLRCLFKPARYKVLYGGRGASKSWSVARTLLILGTKKPLLIL